MMFTTSSVDNLMKEAVVEWLDGDKIFYAEIPSCPGVWATGKTEEECLKELREVLEDWIKLD